MDSLLAGLGPGTSNQLCNWSGLKHWFARLTNKRLKYGSFNSVAQLTEAIDVWVSHWNDDPKRFVCTKIAQKIMTKVRPGQRVKLNHLTKSTTHH